MHRRQKDAFQKMIAPSLGRLFSTAYRLAGNVADAEDLVQDACVAAWEQLDRLIGMEYPERWLLRVLYHRFVDGARRRARAPVVPLHDDTERRGSACQDGLLTGLDELTDRARAFRAACARLSESHRVLLSLRAEGYALPEIAEITGIDSSVLRGRLHRARENLARHLADTSEVDGHATRFRSNS